MTRSERMEMSAQKRTRFIRGLVGLISVVFVSSFGWVPLTAYADGQSEPNRDGMFILELAPSSVDSALWSLTRQTLGRFDSSVLSEKSDQTPEMTTVAQAYSALEDQLVAGQKEPLYFKLTSIPSTLVRNFEKGDLPQSVLFAAAKKVEPLTVEAASEAPFPKVSVFRTMANSSAVLNQINALRVAADGLDDLALARVTGRLSAETMKPMVDDRLRHLVKEDKTEVATLAQGELDRRLAENLPDLSKYKNGLIPDDLLCPIKWAKDHRLLCVAMDNFERMNQAYKDKFGSDLPILDGYRPLSDQERVHYEDPNWTAEPGTSNHGWGLAVDFDWDIFVKWDAPEVQWMIKNGPDFGWRLPSALGPKSDRPEPWHYEFGTYYSDNTAEDFLGDVPEVVYRFQFG